MPEKIVLVTGGNAGLGFECCFQLAKQPKTHVIITGRSQQRTKRIVMLTSYTYDPAEKSGVPAPNVSNLNQLARGYDKFDPMEAYSTSKLINLDLRVLAGFHPETSLFREQHWLAWMIQKPIYKFFTWLGGGCITTTEHSGDYIAKLAAEEPLTPDYTTGAYLRVDEPWEANVQATDRKLGKELWEKSEVWAGLK